MGEESPRVASGPSHVLGEHAGGARPVASDPQDARGRSRGCVYLRRHHVAGGYPHAQGRVVLWPRPTVGTIDQPSLIVPLLPSLPTSGIPKVSCIIAESRTRIAWQCSSVNSI